MPTIRDAQGRLTVHDMTPPPPGPPPAIERRQGSPAPPDERLPDTAIRRTTSLLEASRIRGNAASAAAKATPPGPPPAPERKRHPTTTPVALTPRQFDVLEAVRATGSRAAAARNLGVVYQSIDEVLVNVARKGLLPADITDVPARVKRILEAQAPVSRAGLTDAEHRRAVAAVTTASKGQEAGAPATDAGDRVTEARPSAAAAAPPPGPSLALDSESTTGSIAVGSVKPSGVQRAVLKHPDQFEAGGGPVDVVSVRLSIDLTADELATWHPKRLELLLRGVAAVTTARWGLES